MVENLKKNLIPIAIIIAGLLVAGAIIYINQGKEKISGLLSPQQAAEKAIGYINQNLLQEGSTASLISVTEEKGVYKFRLKIGETEYDSYVTKDGKILFTQGVDLEEKIAEKNTDESGGNPEVSIPPEKLGAFIECLRAASVVIYGANWCGYTKQLVTMLGGWDTVKPIYVECTEKTQLCEEKEIKGYPTILINGKEYGGQRTFQGFKEATNCEIPPEAESLPQGTPSGGCE